MIYYGLILYCNIANITPILLTVSMSGPLPIELILKPYVQLKEVSAYTLCYCSAATFERYLHQSKKISSGQTD